MKTRPEKTVCLFAALACASHCAFAAPLRIDVKPGDSLTAVRDRVRALSATEKANGVEVVVADGEYVAPDYGIEFTAADGCIVDGKPVVVWRAEHQGKARIVGAARIPPSSFAKVDDPALLARLPEEGRGKVYAADVSAFCPKTIPQVDDAFNGLPRPPVVIMDGSLGTFASYPNGGKWMSFDKCIDHGTPVPGKKSSFTGGAFVCEDPRCMRWDFSKGVWLCGYFFNDWHYWCVKAASCGIEDGTNVVMRIGKDALMPYGIKTERSWWGNMEYRRFRAFNLFEELDEPGEWWLDREKKILYVVPPGGRMTDSTDIRLTFSERPIICGGGSKRPSGIRFEGLDLGCRYGGFVNLAGAMNVTFSGCRFIGCVKGAVVISGMSNVVSRCEIAQCGSSGIFISGGDRKMLVRSDSTIEGCEIHDFGVYQRTHAPGIHVDGNGCGMTVRGNVLHDAPNAAIFYGGNEHLFEYNNVYRVVMENCDAGAYYTGRDWTTQGNVLRFNYTHDLGMCGNLDSIMGFYFDDCDCGDEVYGNIFHNVSRGIMVGGGRDHPIRNNIFSRCLIGLSIDARAKTWASELCSPEHMESKARKFDYTNGVWAAKYPRLAGIMSDCPREPLYNPVENNIFIDCRKMLVSFEQNPSLERLAPIANNLVVNTFGTNGVECARPLWSVKSGFKTLNGSTNAPCAFGFADAANGDFRLLPGAEVLKECSGFQPIPLDRIPPDADAK